MLIDIAYYLGIVFVVLVVHEFGHYVAARYYGVKVQEFSIGIGPILYSKLQKETTWNIRAFFVAGYVSMFYQKEIEHESDKEGNLYYLHPLKKIAVFIAGIVMNLILAFCLYVSIGMMEHKEYSNAIGNIEQNSSAQIVGIQSGDVMVALNNQPIRIWSDYITLKDEVKSDKFTLTIKRNGIEKNFLIIPKVFHKKTKDGKTIEKSYSGLAPNGKMLVSFGLIESLSYGYERTIRSIKNGYSFLHDLFVGEVKVQELAGPITMTNYVGEVKESGIISLLALLGSLSITIAIANLIPLPVLDGGQIVFAFYEFITTKQPNEKMRAIITVGSIVLLVVLEIVVIFFDILRNI